MQARYEHVDPREGIRKLITELGNAKNRAKFGNGLFLVDSMKWIHLIATGCEPPRAVLIRPFNEFTIGYTTEVPCNDPAYDNHVEVVRTGNGQLCFVENGHLLAAAELVDRLIHRAAEGIT